jgi:hypothetical protein
MLTTIQRTDDIVKRLDQAAKFVRFLILLYFMGATGASGISYGLGYVALGLLVGIIAGVFVAALFTACIDWMRQLLLVQNKILLELSKEK